VKVMDTKNVDYTVFNAALSVLASALVGEGKVGANDILTEWAARKIKVAVPFGKDFVVLEAKARHKVGLSEDTLGYVARLAYGRLGHLIGLVSGVTARSNGQVVSVKTDVDGLEIKVSIAGMRAELGELPLSYVPPMTAKPAYRRGGDGGAELDAYLLNAGLSRAMLDRMTDATKSVLLCELLEVEEIHKAEPDTTQRVDINEYVVSQGMVADDDEGEAWTPPGASYTTNRPRKPTVPLAPAFVPAPLDMSAYRPDIIKQFRA
jgi:hypothetical protein